MLRAVFALVWLCAAPAASAGDYALQAGDKLRVEILQQSELNRSVLVLPDGSFSFPMVGKVQAKGRSLEAVQAILRDGLASMFVTPPDVYVSVTALAPRARTSPARTRSAIRAGEAARSGKIAVFAMGELNRPGRIEIAPGTTLIQFVAQAGGMTAFAADKRIRVQRRNAETGQVQIVKVNMRSAMRNGLSPVGALAEGDVVIVPARRLFE